MSLGWLLAPMTAMTTAHGATVVDFDSFASGTVLTNHVSRILSSNA